MDHMNGPPSGEPYILAWPTVGKATFTGGVLCGRRGLGRRYNLRRNNRHGREQRAVRNEAEDRLLLRQRMNGLRVAKLYRKLRQLLLYPNAYRGYCFAFVSGRGSSATV